MESSGHDKNDDRLVGNLYMMLGYTPRAVSSTALACHLFLSGRKKCTPDLQATDDRKQSARRFVLLSQEPQASRTIGRRSQSSDGLFETVREQERVSRPTEV